MTSVTLRTVWINTAASPSDFRSFQLMSSLTVATVQPGEVRQLASGRSRLVLKAGGVKRTIAAELPLLDRSDVQWLEDHVGVLVCVRDDRGRKVWGSFLTVPVDESATLTTADVSLAVIEVTHDESA
ncbi:MAG: hypothetical protein PSX37_13325 [bacterium]|nr:hypothetical protein [bacterium]